MPASSAYRCVVIIGGVILLFGTLAAKGDESLDEKTKEIHDNAVTNLDEVLAAFNEFKAKSMDQASAAVDKAVDSIERQWLAAAPEIEDIEKHLQRLERVKSTTLKELSASLPDEWRDHVWRENLEREIDELQKRLNEEVKAGSVEVVGALRTSIAEIRGQLKPDDKKRPVSRPASPEYSEIVGSWQEEGATSDKGIIVFKSDGSFIPEQGCGSEGAWAWSPKGCWLIVQEEQRMFSCVHLRVDTLLRSGSMTLGNEDRVVAYKRMPARN